jgi:hypothetical protein
LLHRMRALLRLVALVKWSDVAGVCSHHCRPVLTGPASHTPCLLCHVKRSPEPLKSAQSPSLTFTSTLTGFSAPT